MTEDDQLKEALEDADAGLEPSPFGELLVSFPISPVSPQSQSASKEAQRRLIVDELSRFAFLLIGDVQIEVTWFASARSRYESDSSPDVDNILKPLLDALSGPSGVLVDDCQVRAIGASCLSTSGSERVDVQIKFHPDDFIKKSDVLFIDVGRALCVPITGTLLREALRILMSAMENMLAMRANLEALGVEADPRMLMIGPRVFHKTRIAKHFRCETLASFNALHGFE